METSIVVRLIDETRQGLTNIQSNLRSIDDGVDRVSRGFAALGTAVAAAFSMASLKAVYDLTDNIQTLDNKLRLVTTSTSDLNTTYSRLLSLANESRSSLDATATLYSKLALNQEAAGLAGRDLYKVVEAFNKTLTISGASATEAASATYQFGQAMQSGKLQGDEFRAMAEANPRFLKLISEQTGIATGELKKLASEGMLNAKIIGLALEQGLGDLSAQFEKMPMTVGQATQVLTNEFNKLSREFLAGTGLGEDFVKVIQHITKNLDNFAAVGKILATALAAALIYFAPITAGAIALGAAIVYLIEPIGKVANAMINLSEDVMNGLMKKFTQFSAMAKAVSNLENPFDAFAKAGKDFDVALAKNSQSLKTTSNSTNEFSKSVTGATNTEKINIPVTAAMQKELDKAGITALRGRDAFKELKSSLENQIEAAKQDEEQRKKQIFIFKEMEKVQESFRKAGNVLSEAQVKQMKEEIGVMYDQLIAAEDVTKKRKQLTDDFYNFIKANQSKSLNDVQIFDDNITKSNEARAMNARITETDLQQYLDANRAQYSAKYVAMIESQNLANLTSTDKYLKEISQLEDDIRKGRLSKDINEAQVRTAIAKKYNEEYVKLAKEGQASVLSDTQNYLNKVAEIENAFKLGIITSEIDKQNAILGARRQYGAEFDRMAQESRDRNQTAEQIYLAKMLEFNTANAAGLIKNEADAAAIRKKINEDYATAVSSQYSNLYGLLNSKLVEMTGLNNQQVGYMKEAFKLFGVDTDKILKDLFAQGILYIKGFLTGGQSDITTLGGLFETIFGSKGSSTNTLASFASGAVDLFKGLASQAGSIFGGLGSVLGNIFDGLGSGLISTFGSIASYLSTNVLSLLNSIIGGASSAVSALARVIGGGGGGGGGGIISDIISIGGAIFSFFSDERMKENIAYNKTLANGINLYDFEYKTQFKRALGGGRKTGVIAQDVMGRYPNAVSKTSSGMLMVNYDQLPIPKNLLKLAKGGIVDRPTMVGSMTMAGEAGPEAVLPLNRGSNGELGVSMDGMGVVNVNFTVNTMDAKDFDSMLINKKQLITNIVSNAVRQGRSFA